MKNPADDAAGAPVPARLFAKFETGMSARTDDIDLYQHVHGTRYPDHVLAARFEQMERYHGMPMQESPALGPGWHMTSATIHYRRPPVRGDRLVVRTWIGRFAENGQGLRVRFELEKLPGKKRVCDGRGDYVPVSPATGRGVAIPDEILSNHTI
jgi:acyl-CoA thioester hydrolase/thioesterase-3